MVTGRDIIVVSGASFEDNWTCKQEIAKVLSLNNRVLYVNNIPNVYRPVRGWQAELVEAFPNLFVYYPPPLRLPLDFAFRVYSDFLQKQVVKRVKQVVHSMGFQKPILWLFDFRTAPYVAQFDECVSIYQCVDKWHLLTSGIHCRPENIKRLEGGTVQKVDRVFATAKDLQKHIWDNYGREAYYLPHGVDFDLFSGGADQNGLIHRDIKGISKPVLGFVGTVDVWVDCELIVQIAQKMPQASIVLIGPVNVAEDRERFEQVPNIHLLGPRPKATLPEYLRHFDVCLLPFKMNELTRSVNPLKLLEYLATGKPVVSAPLDEVVQNDGLVYAAQGAEAFVLAIENALAEQGDQAKKERMNFARQHTWQRQIDDALDFLKGN